MNCEIENVLLEIKKEPTDDASTNLLDITHPHEYYILHNAEVEESENCETDIQPINMYAKEKVYMLHVDGDSVCRLCLKVFLSPEDLKIHHQRIHVEKLYRCDTTTNINPVIANSDILYYCNLCSFKSDTSNSCQDHIKFHSEQRLQLFISISKNAQYIYDYRNRHFRCKLCEFKNLLHSVVKIHVNRVHLSVKNHICELCGKTYHYVKSLTNHVRIHTGEKRNKCSICDFATYTHLHNHMKIHKEKLHKCNVCEFKSPDLPHLKVHMRIHTGEKYLNV